MKSFFNVFKRKAPKPTTPANESPSIGTDVPKIPLGLKDPSKSFLPTSISAMVTVGLLIIALGAFGYRFFQNKKENAIVNSIVATKSPTAFNPSGKAAKDPLTSARELFENKQIDDSIQIYEQLLKKSPKDAQVLNDLGILYLKRQKLDESEQHLKRSIELQPNCSVCLNNLGYLKTLQGEDAQAEVYLKKAIEANSDYVDPYFNLGVLYEKNGDIGRSANAYAEYLKRSKDKDSPFNVELRQHLFSILEK